MQDYQNLFNLRDKVAIVTGAAGILGMEFCKALYISGATVLGIDINISPLERLIRDTINQNHQERFIAYQCDISNPKSILEVVSKIITRFSRIDILLNNAATKTKDLQSFFSSFSDYSLDVWREIMAVNLDGMFLMAQAVGKHMIAQKQGTIIQTASIYSLLGPDQRIYEGSQYLGQEINTPAAYTASKAGVIGLTKHLAALWGEYKIRVNALCPGGVLSGQNEEFHKKYSARVPLGRMAQEADIVGPMLFLASDASSYVTGQVLFVDGGLSAW